MPGELKLRGGDTKYLYKKAVVGLIGEDLAYRKKQMFTVPVGDWFRREKVDYCKQHIKLLQGLDGIVDVEKAMRLLGQHVAGTHNHTREIRALISLSHWIDCC